MQPRFQLLLGLTGLCALSACTRSRPAADAGTSAKEPPPSIEVRADREDLVFSFMPEGARSFETATRLADVPASARRAVVVTDLSLSPEVRQAGRYIYIADLRAARDDGTYPVALASRYGFETGTSSAAAAAGLAPSGGEVIMYSASWCGVCKKAKRVMNSWGVDFVEKDVEGSRAAAQELAQKAAANGFRPGGVPVIDVGGTILQGFDERALRQALVAKGLMKGS